MDQMFSLVVGWHSSQPSLTCDDIGDIAAT